MNKKFALSALADILLFSSLVTTLVLFRNIFKGYFQQLQEKGADIYLIADALQQGTINSSSTQVTTTISVVNDLLQKAFILNYIILPLSIILLFFIFQSLSWHIINKTPIKKTILYLIAPLILLILFVLTLLNTLSFYFLGEGSSNRLIVIIIAALLLIACHIMFFGLSLPNKSLLNLFTIMKKKARVIPWFLLFMLTLTVVFFLTTIMYIFLLIQISIFILAIVSILLILLLNLQKMHLIKKIQ